MGTLDKRYLRWLLAALMLPALLLPRGLTFAWCSCPGVEPCCGAPVSCCDAPPPCCSGTISCCDRPRGVFAAPTDQGEGLGQDCDCCHEVTFEGLCQLTEAEASVERVFTGASIAPVQVSLAPRASIKHRFSCRAPPDVIPRPGLFPGTMPMRV